MRASGVFAMLACFFGAFGIVSVCRAQAPSVPGTMSSTCCGVPVSCSTSNPADCDAACTAACAGPSAPSSGSGGNTSGSGASGGSFTPMQQMELNAAHDFGAALGGAFVNWLLSPPDHQGQQRAMQDARQHELAMLQRQRQREQQDRLRFQQEHMEVFANEKGPGLEPDLAAKPLDDTPPPLTSQDAQALENLKNQVRTLDCGMAEIYAAADTLGPAGKDFSAALAKDVLAAERQLPQTHLAGGACEALALSRHSSEESTHAANGSQLEVSVTGTRFANGQSTLTINYELSKNGETPTRGQSVVVLNSTGTVDCEEVTPVMGSCLKHAGLAGGVFSGRRYCPRPPPDNLQGQGYPACGGASIVQARADTRPSFNELRDAPISASRRTVRAPDAPRGAFSPRRAGAGPTGIVEGAPLKRDDSYEYLPFSNTTSRTVTVAVCALHRSGRRNLLATSPIAPGAVGEVALDYSGAKDPVVRYATSVGSDPCVLLGPPEH